MSKTTEALACHDALHAIKHEGQMEALNKSSDQRSAFKDKYGQGYEAAILESARKFAEISSVLAHFAKADKEADFWWSRISTDDDAAEKWTACEEIKDDLRKRMTDMAAEVAC